MGNIGGMSCSTTITPNKKELNNSDCAFNRFIICSERAISVHSGILLIIIPIAYTALVVRERDSTYRQTARTEPDQEDYFDFMHRNALRIQ